MPAVTSPAEVFVPEDTPPVEAEQSLSKNFKSGYDISNQAIIVNKVNLPHGFISRLKNFTTTKLDQLSMEAFFYGYFSVLMQVDDRESHCRLGHAKQILWHCIHHGWDSAREFHYQVLQELECGNLRWDDQPPVIREPAPVLPAISPSPHTA